MNRDALLKKVRERSEPWDMIVIGGGATGAGVAVDAATRGYSTLLLERQDFGQGTSSRSTKLVHGGVRYLEQGNVSLVMEALKERGILRQNAPHLVNELRFVVPTYSWWRGPFYGLGLKLYQMLAGKYGFGPSQFISKEETLEKLPNVNPEGLLGGVVYYDGQFDDARLLIHLIATAQDYGAAVLNYAEVVGLRLNTDGLLDSVDWVDRETGEIHRSIARVVVNATGPFTDSVRSLSDPEAPPMIAPSQGSHIVLDRSFLPGDTAIMVPHTSDGRVMFAIPWHDHTLVGTTDFALPETPREPRAEEEEIQFMLETAGLYLHKKPTRADILSTFAGVRPLVRAGGGKNTSALSRDHTIHIDPSGLLSVTGGKWTTYRNMAEDCVNQAAILGDLPEVDCKTKGLHIHGYLSQAEKWGHLSVYGSDAEKIQALLTENPAWQAKLDEALPFIEAEVIWAVRHEMARHLEDVLSRRLRALVLHAAAARRMAPRVAQLMAEELGKDESWQAAQLQSFDELARAHLVSASSD